MNNDDLIDAIDIVRDALMTNEEEEQFQRIIDRLEGYEIAYKVLLSKIDRYEDLALKHQYQTILDEMD
jgi:GTP-binding protein EngB required for normal cell division